MAAQRMIAAEGSLLSEIVERGSIRIACQWGRTAEQYLDPRTGEPSGVVAEVGRLLAKDLEVGAEFVELAWDDHLPALVEGRVDVCLKHTNIPQRAFLVDFTPGVLLTYEGILVVRRDRGWVTDRVLDDSGMTIAATSGSLQQRLAGERYPQAVVRTVPNASEGMQAVKDGHVDACLTDANLFEEAAHVLEPECATLTDADGERIVVSRDASHPCIRAGDQRFLNWLSNWLDYHRMQGSIDRIIEESNERYREAALAQA